MQDQSPYRLGDSSDAGPRKARWSPAWSVAWVLLPLWIVASVGWGMLVVGVEQPVPAVVVRGGPVPAGARQLSLALEAQAVSKQRRVPLAHQSLTAQWYAAGQPQTDATCTTNSQGLCELLLGPPPDGDPRQIALRVEGLRRVLAEVPAAQLPSRWPPEVEEHSGWVRGSPSGELALRVAVAEGVLAVPFVGSLLIARGDSEASPAPWSLSLDLQGAELHKAPHSLSLPPDAPLELGIEPQGHAISLRVVARTEEGKTGQWFGALPVVQGAMVARWSQGLLEVRSPIVREHAFVSWVTRRERKLGVQLALTPQPDGTAVGTWAPPGWLMASGTQEDPSEELAWTLVSSEQDRRSAGTVGWRVLPALPAMRPASTFHASDLLWADGRRAALDRELERAALGRRRAVYSALAGAAVLLLLMGWRLTGTTAAPLIVGLSPQTVTQARQARAALLLCVALGLLALAWLGLQGAGR